MRGRDGGFCQLIFWLFRTQVKVSLVLVGMLMNVLASANVILASRTCALMHVVSSTWANCFDLFLFCSFTAPPPNPPDLFITDNGYSFM